MTQSRFFSSVAQPNSLQSNITSSATAIPLANPPVGYPVSTPFTIALDYGDSIEELCDVTAVAGSVFTVTRAVDGTSAASHGVGAAIRHVSSARDFNEANAHINSSMGVHGILSGSSVVGTTDTQTLTNKTLAGPVITGTIPFLSLGVTNPVGTSPLVIEASPSQTAKSLSILNPAGNPVLGVSADGLVTLTSANATSTPVYFAVNPTTPAVGSNVIQALAGGVNLFAVTGEGRTVGNYSGTASAVQVIPSNVTGGGFEADLPTSSTGLSFLAKLNGVTVFNVDSGGVVHPSGIANTGNMTNTGVIASTGDISTSGNLNVVNGTVTALGAQFGNNGISAIAGDAPLGVALQAHKASTTSVTSSTVMFPDPDLFFSFSGAGGSSYFVEFFLSYNSGATGKFTTQWSVGGSATISSTARNAQGLDSTVSNATPAGIMRSGQHGYTTSVTYGDRAGTASLYAYECGTVTLSSGGPCQVGLSFAQSVSNATPVNLVTGSYARLTRIS